MNAAPEDALEIFIRPGEFYFGDGNTRIRTILGSCVAVTLWHPERHIGGMCHYMLPRRPRRKAGEPAPLDGRYAEDAMRMFLAEIRLARAQPSDFQVKLFGGSRMLLPKADRRPTIAEANVEFGRAAIDECGFRLSAEDLGGNGHRNVILDLWSGDVWVRKAEARD